MMEIFEMRDGRPVRTDEIKQDVWINLTAPTAEEIEQVQSALNIDREALTSALDDEEGSRTEVSQDYTLILIDAPTREWRNNREEFTTYPLSITVTDTAIVTVCLQELFALTNIVSGKTKSKSTFDVANRARFVLQILFRVAINYQTDLKYIEVKRMAIEESIRKATRRDDQPGLLQDVSERQRIHHRQDEQAVPLRLHGGGPRPHGRCHHRDQPGS